ncbi:MAG: RidA family protein [Anaerolineae bacterium]|nr:RidA family protein [Anaerolineae bacterium]
MSIEAKIQELGIKLPEPWPDFRSVKMARQVGNIVFTSAHAPSLDGKVPFCLGVIGQDVDSEQAQKAARLCALSALASIKKLVGSLDRVKRVLRVCAFLQVAPDFRDQGPVMNSFSDVLVEIFGEEGKHTRTTVGTPTMIGNQAMEIELWVEVE